MRSEARALLAGALVLLGLGAFVASRIDVTSDITHLLPGGERDADVELARQLAVGELSRTLVLLVEPAPEHPEARERLAEASRAFEDALRAEPRVAAELLFLDGGPPKGIEEAMYLAYQPRRFSFFAGSAEEARERTTDDALDALAADLKERLASPLSGLVSRVAPADPALVLPHLFERLSAGRGDDLTLRDGRFLCDDGGAAVLFLGTKSSSTDAPAQRPVLEGIDAAFAAANEALGGDFALATSGAHRFAVRAEGAIRSDIQRVSIGSTIGLFVLLFVFFRSLRLFAMVLPVVGAGLLAGTSACLAIFGSVHGLTLAFGAGMIGVCVDYAIHFQCHQRVAPDPGGPRRTLAAIWPGLALSAATTALGFFTLCLSSFPGLREMAVFAATGIVAALGATWAFLPGLAERASDARLRRGIAPTVARVLGALLDRHGAQRYLLLVPSALVVVLAVLGLPRIAWNDDIGSLNRLDPELLREDEAVRERVARYDQRRLVVALGATEEEALRVNDRIARVVSDLEAEGALGGARTAATLLPSAQQQRDVDAALRTAPELWPRFERALAAQGFRTELFRPFVDALAEAPPAPLTYEDLAATALGPLVRPFRISIDGGVGFVTYLHDLRDEAELRARLSEIDGARLIDIERTLSAAFGTYRAHMALLLAAGFAGVLALVALRHRAWRPTLIAYLPAVLAAAGTLATLSLIGIELNMLTLVALLMVVGMGVDYGVLLAETNSGGPPRGDHARVDATYLALVVAAASTLLGFGLLALSDQPPLFSIGVTAGVGVLLCVVLAPTLCAFLRERDARP